MNIPDLIQEAKQGVIPAQKWLFDLYRDKMHFVCRSYVRSPEDAEECLMDGFFKIFNALEAFEYNGEAAFFQWMKRTMINQCLMFLRNKNVYVLVGEFPEEMAPLKAEAIDNLAADEIMRMVTNLPVGCRSIFNLFVFEDMTHSEIAELLGITEGTSKSQFAYARKLLQKWILKIEKYYGRDEQSR